MTSKKFILSSSRIAVVAALTALSTVASFMAGTSAAQAQHSPTSLVVHAAELGVGKFHRMDHKKHPYGAANGWKNFILPDGVNEQTPIVLNNNDGSTTIFFSNLDELLTTIENVAKKQNKPVQIININGHGMPGGMWYPKDAATQASSECSDWRDNAEGTDEVNYSQYYSPISKGDVMSMRRIAEMPGASFPCVTNLDGWREIVGRHTSLKSILSPDLQVHLASCIVGLGSVGDEYTRGLAEVLLTGSNGQVKTSLMFGLGDWSIPEGMSFWDYQNDAQLKHDNSVYVANHTDREIMQKGTIRIASLDKGGKGSVSSLLTQVSFMNLGLEPEQGTPAAVIPSAQDQELSEMAIPAFVRIPGTTVYVSPKF